jgi:hypothetical protein
MERQFFRAWLAFPPHRVARYEKSAVTIRLICGGVLYGSVTCCFVCPDTPPTIPNDYPSSTTIPKLNCCFPERTVTMQEIYADRCREEHCWGED